MTENTIPASKHLSCKKWNKAYTKAVSIFGSSHFHPKAFAYHRCFCQECHNKRNDELEYCRAGQKYELPVGYCAIALKKYKPPKKVHVKSFHGTNVSAIQKILE